MTTVGVGAVTSKILILAPNPSHIMRPPNETGTWVHTIIHFIGFGFGCFGLGKPNSIERPKGPSAWLEYHYGLAAFVGSLNKEPVSQWRADGIW
ncbi:MAG: hypothetical protein V3V02_02925 [Rhizobiaceae bacterium]